MRVRLVAVALLALMFVLAGGAALRESVTIDEVAHIGAGVSYWQRLDLRFNEEHPPLAKLISALPLAIRGTHADYSNPAWNLGTNFFQGYVGEWLFGDYLLTRWNDPRSTLAWARFPMLLLTVALGWLVFTLARRLGGDWGGLLCVAVYATTPVLLVFGPLVLTDVPITLFSLLAMLAMARLWDDPGRANTRLMGFALAGAILTKFTGVLLYFAFIGVSLSMRWRPAGDPPAPGAGTREWRKLRWRSMRKATLFAALIVYAVYFVFSWNQPVNIPGLAGHGPLLGFLGRLLMPPWLLLCGLGWVVITGNRPAFLLGHAYPHGVWFFFPVLLALKSAPGFLALLAVAAAVAFVAVRLRWKPVIPKTDRMLWRVLWVSLVVYAAICIVSHFDVSIRHFSTPLVLLILMLAPLPRLIGRVRDAFSPAAWSAGALVAVAAGSCLVTAVRSYPYYFPYINFLGAGHPGYWLVSDSNYDWNHSLPDVEQFAVEHKLDDVPIDIYGFSDETAFVPHARLWDCQEPAETDAGKWAVVSANMIMDQHNCTWLLQFPQVLLAGGSMIAVQLPPAIPAAGSSGGPPAPDGRRKFLGFPVEMRQLFQGLERDPEGIPKAIADTAQAQRKLREAKK